MRLTLTFLLMSLLAVGSLARGQTTRSNVTTKESTQVPQETLAIGVVEVRLGMPQDTTMAHFASAGYKLMPQGENTWFVEQSNGSGGVTILGNVAFKNNGVTFINRSWTPDEVNAAAIGESIYGVLSATYKEGRSMCTLSTDDQQNPTAEVKEINLSCHPGRKYVSIVVVHYQGHESVSVSETLKAE